MALPLLAAQSDVEALLQTTLTGQQVTWCAALLATASGKVREFVGNQVISAVAGDVLTLQGTWDHRLVLPQRPVTNVASVTVSGVQTAPIFWVCDRAGNLDALSSAYAPSGAGSPWYFGGVDFLDGSPQDPVASLLGPAGSTFYPRGASGPSWFGPAATVTITYDHGWATIPSSVVDVVAGLVAGAIATPVGIGSEQIGGYKVVYNRPQGGAAMNLTDDMKKSLGRLKRQSATLAAGHYR